MPYCYWDWVLSLDILPVSAGAAALVSRPVVVWPRAFIAASVAAQSIPPFLRHPSVREALEPSLQATVSAAVAVGFPALPLSPNVGPVCTPGSALRIVSVGGPVYPTAPLSPWPVGWAAAAEVSPR